VPTRRRKEKSDQVSYLPSSRLRPSVHLTKLFVEIYLIFIALHAAPIALLLTKPEKVQRSDGSKVKVIHEKPFAAEIRALGRAVSRRHASPKHPNFMTFP
jgi:hypothetical protein